MKNVALVLIIVIMLTIFSGCQSLVSQPALGPSAEQGGLPDSSAVVDEDLPAGEDSIPEDNMPDDNTDLDADLPAGDINSPVEEPADEEKPASGQVIDKGEQPAEVKVPAGFAYNAIKYEILEGLPEELAALVEEKKMSAVAEVIKEESDYKFVLISLGERSTGGYSVGIVEVADIENGKATVRYREVKPAPDAMVTQAITYPYAVLKIESSLPVVFEEVAASAK